MTPLTLTLNTIKVKSGAKEKAGTEKRESTFLYRNY